MALKPLPGFKSLITHHCITGSMRHIYEFHDYPLSEDLLLGLGDGVGFVYWHIKGTPPFYGGRANVGRPGEEGMERTAGRRTGVVVEFFQTSSVRKAEKAMLKMLSGGEPVMIDLDMGFLPYLDLPEGYHFGGHAVVVAGYDHDSRQVLIADRDKELHPVSIEDLGKARGSTFKPFPPKNKWYIFNFEHKRPPKRSEVENAIRTTVTGMLNPSISNLGVEGIRKASGLTLKWPEIMDEEQLRFACFNIFIFIDATGGTGGGIFRYMYGRFLREAARITGDNRLVGSAEDFRHIGDRWQVVAGIFKKASQGEPRSSLQEIGPLLGELADLEEAAWSRLGEIVPEPSK